MAGGPAAVANEAELSARGARVMHSLAELRVLFRSLNPAA
jgi:hypothetical protein